MTKAAKTWISRQFQRWRMRALGSSIGMHRRSEAEQTDAEGAVRRIPAGEDD